MLNKQKQNHKRYLIDRGRQIEMHWTNLIQICDMCLIYIDLRQIIKNKIRIQYTLYTRFYSISPLFGPDIENKHTKLSPVLVQKRILLVLRYKKKNYICRCLTVCSCLVFGCYQIRLAGEERRPKQKKLILMRDARETHYRHNLWPRIITHTHIQHASDSLRNKQN